MIWISMAIATIVGPFDFDVGDLICLVFLRFLLIRVGHNDVVCTHIAIA